FLRRAFCVVAAGGLVAAAGCTGSDHYAPDLKYAVRTDFIVRESLTAVPVAFNTPGHLPLDFLATLPTKFDANKKARGVDYSKVDRQIADKKLNLDENQKLVLKEWRENETRILDPRNLTTAERNKIGDVLSKLFGTPS